MDGSAIIVKEDTTFTRFESWDDMSSGRVSAVFELPDAHVLRFDVVGTTLYTERCCLPGIALERWDLISGERLEDLELSIELEPGDIDGFEVTADRVYLITDWTLGNSMLYEIDLATGQPLGQGNAATDHGLACGVIP